MNGSEQSRGTMIWGICAVLGLWAFGAQAAELPPDPNNAALLYYQALALWSDVRSSYVDRESAQEPNDRSDTEPNTAKPKPDKYDMPFQVGREQEEADRESFRQRMRGLTLELIEAASRMPRCDWGIYHSKGWGLAAVAKLRHIAFLLEDDAKALVAAGDYRAALERCLTIRRFARHLGDETITLHNVSLGIDGVAFRGIREVLNAMPPDAEVLTWLKGEPAMSWGAPVSFVRMLGIHLQRAVERIDKSPKTVARIRNRWIGEAAANRGNEGEEKIRSITDETLVSEVRKITPSVFADFLDSLDKVLEKNKPYDQTYIEIDLLTHKLLVHDLIEPFYDITCVMITTDFYRISVNHRARMNALKAAIEIYLIKAKTGELPDTIPNELPKDPYTCRDFVYELIDDGFALRCQGKPRRTLEFKVRE
ncbi:MAG: hypothetical protein ACYTE3_05585 [Planctomycetota bacterium]